MKKVSFLFLLLFIFCGETSTNKEIKDTTITSLETLEAITEDEPELYVILMSQDGYGPNSSRIREINPSAEQYRGGGAPNIVNHPNIFDTIHPDSGVQEDLLSSYQDYAGSVDDILDKDLGTIPLVSKDS
jgi:hypothetical protein